MSKFFPQWITADAILRDMIAPKLGGYFSSDGSNVICSLLPNDAIYLVPPEDRERFSEIVGDFSAWAAEALDLEECFGRRLYSAISDSLFWAMAADVDARIAKFNSDNHISFQEKFLEMMGVSLVIRSIRFEVVCDERKKKASDE